MPLKNINGLVQQLPQSHMIIVSIVILYIIFIFTARDRYRLISSDALSPCMSNKLSHVTDMGHIKSSS